MSATAVSPEGWLAGARRVPSPHADERPAGAGVELIVIHGASLPAGRFGGPWLEDLFAGRLDVGAHPEFALIPELGVAPHLLVRRDGEVVQFVPFLRRAWHAGRSAWRGRRECNDYSVGIELEGTDRIPYTEAQYGALDRILPALRAAYPAIGDDAVVAHSDVAPGRKTDPGPAFDWGRLGGGLTSAGYNFRRSPARQGESGA